MKNLNIALRSLFKKGRSNGIKILSLGVGLAMGLVLISKVCFERSFDTFQKYDDSEAVIEEIWEKGDLVRTLPGCVHTLTALGESNVLTIEFSPQPYVARDVLMNDKK